MNQQDRVQQAADALASVSGQSPVEAKRVLSEYDTRDLIASVAAEGVGGGNGGGSVVSAVLARDAAIDIHDAGDHPILWDALYDNYIEFGTLLAIPDGLGLDFDFDSSSADITTTEAGVWAFTYNFTKNGDTDWTGSLDTRFGAQDIRPGNAGVSILVSQVLAIPAAHTFGPQFNTANQATADPYNVNGIYLIASRLA